MPRASRSETSNARQDTRERLLLAAVGEFNERGYHGTDTNRIARRAGFAPQTFYRWFDDKIAIFIAVYDWWQQEEFGTIARLLSENAPDQRLVSTGVAYHRSYLKFRRSLRQLSYEDDKVRAARAASRLRQIEFLQGWIGSDRSASELAVDLFELERLSDALAEGEFDDLGLSPTAAEQKLAEIIHSLRKSRSGSEKNSSKQR
jgi:AcrR family transcriptional regulator